MEVDRDDLTASLARRMVQHDISREPQSRMLSIRHESAVVLLKNPVNPSDVFTAFQIRRRSPLKVLAVASFHSSRNPSSWIFRPDSCMSTIGVEAAAAPCTTRMTPPANDARHRRSEIPGRGLFLCRKRAIMCNLPVTART
jgi:hypothetical protein